MINGFIAIIAVEFVFDVVFRCYYCSMLIRTQYKCAKSGVRNSWIVSKKVLEIFAEVPCLKNTEKVAKEFKDVGKLSIDGEIRSADRTAMG